MPPMTSRSWKKPTRNPRIARGEFSDTYVGASMVPAPRPIPSINLPLVSITVPAYKAAAGQKVLTFQYRMPADGHMRMPVESPQRNR